ncbi:uncharacterized protein LOC143297164 [Babylonia areolata]|uniref:uncharacterized protein LOC143297164 n=1 Tax=Babylonia areolata TaxID=304850 RepID=UPI003FD4FFE7
MKMMLIVFAVVFIVAGVADHTHALPPTTTTSTTTTLQPPLPPVSSKPVVGRSRHCPQRRCLQRLNTVYAPLAYTSNYAGLTVAIDALCGIELPAAAWCLSRAMTRDCDTSLNNVVIGTYQDFCDVKDELKAGMPCWTSGFQPGMQRCVWRIARYSRMGTCQMLSMLRPCVQLEMERLPRCTREDVVTIRGLFESVGARVCRSAPPVSA